MVNVENKRRLKLVVGIKLESDIDKLKDSDQINAVEMNNLLKSAASLARRLGASLRLVNVCESSPIDDLTGIPWQPAYRWQRKWLESVFFEYRNKQIADAKRRLESLARDMNIHHEVEVNAVAAAYPYQGILADAVANNASLILVGAGTKTADYITKGFATPLALISEAAIPVMVIGGRCNTDFFKFNLKVLLADDLREESAAGVRAGLDWAAKLAAAEILHLHIAKTHEFKELIMRIVPLLQHGVDQDNIAKQSVHDLEDVVLRRLNERMMDFKEVQSGLFATIKQEVRQSKDQSQEIARAADLFGADILMFGKYHKIHRRPFLVGRTTYDALLMQSRAVMVLP